MKVKALLLSALITAFTPLSAGHAKVTYYEPSPAVELVSEVSIAKTFAKSATVIVNTQEAKGTGVFVGEGLVLTAQHVIEDGTRIQITDAKGTVFTETTVLLADAWRDLALIKVSTTDNAFFTIAEEALANGDSVFNVGHTLERNFILSDAKVADKNASVAFQSRIIINGDVHPGNSGGPLVNESGDLVGIILSVPATTSGYDNSTAYAAPVKTIVGFIAESLEASE